MLGMEASGMAVQAIDIIGHLPIHNNAAQVSEGQEEVRNILEKRGPE